MINGYWLMEIAGDTTYYFSIDGNHEGNGVVDHGPPPLPGSVVAGGAGKAEKVPVLDSPCSVASDGSSTNWNGIPRVRRKWIDVVEGKALCWH